MWKEGALVIKQAIEMTIREFFGFGGYERSAEGYMSWQHLLFVSALNLLMIVFAIIIGLKYKKKDESSKNRVLMISAILIDSLELFKIILLCIRQENAFHWVRELPLFLCSIQLITIPLAAFSSGRLKNAALDFVTVFGVLGAVLGTYFAGNNYSCYPVLSFDNVISGVTHVISGFVALYIMISGMIRLNKKDIPITAGIIGGFCVAAYIANIFVDCNYMFLSRGDGTPYDILFNMVKGNPVLYPLGVVVLFVLYISAFYYGYYAILKLRQKKKAKEEERELAEIR